MRRLFQEAQAVINGAFRILEKHVPQPQRKPFRDHFVFRYAEQSIEQAIIQKLAKQVSTLNAALVLLDAGYYQEQAILQRVMDEMMEDIIFLSYAVLFHEETKLHKDFLAAFWEEEFDVPDDPLASTQKRPMVSRQKIRAYLSRAEGAPVDPSRGVQFYRMLHKAYSGFVHGASPQIMDMWGGNPGVFNIEGMRGTPREVLAAHDLWNYFHRALNSTMFVALCFGDEDLLQQVESYRMHFEKVSGKNYATPRAKT